MCVFSPASCRLTLWLSDPGGRDLCGLPVRVLPTDGGYTPESRIGQEMGLSSGSWTLEVGSNPPLRVEVNLTPGENKTVDLGRLASLMVTWGGTTPTRGFPYILQGDLGTVVGRVGVPLEVPPGRWTLGLDPSIPLPCPPSREVDLRGGRLTEVELGTSGGVGATPQYLRRALKDELRGALNSLLLRLNRAAPPRVRVEHTPGGILLRDAFGHLVRRKLTLSAGVSKVMCWTLEDNFLPPGPCQVEVEGLAGYHPTVEPRSGIILPALGALEVHLKDPEARSLRGAAVVCAAVDGGARVVGRLGYPIELGPGQYEVEIPLVLGAHQRVHIGSGQVVELDLGVTGWLEGDQVGAVATVTVEGSGHVLGKIHPGEEILALPARYTLSWDGGTIQREAKRRKKYRPSVVFRTAAEPLPLGADGSELS